MVIIPHNRTLHTGPLIERTPPPTPTRLSGLCLANPSPPPPPRLSRSLSHTHRHLHQPTYTHPPNTITTIPAPSHRLRGRPSSHSGPWTATYRRGFGRLITSEMRDPNPKCRPKKLPANPRRPGGGDATRGSSVESRLFNGKKPETRHRGPPLPLSFGCSSPSPPHTQPSLTLHH